MTRILLTGAPGWLGNTLLPRLLDGRAEIRILVDPIFDIEKARSALPLTAGKEVELHSADLRDAEKLARATQGVDTVYHLAAAQHPAKVSEIYGVNTEGTASLARAAAAGGAKRFVFVSSCSVHGENPPGTPVSEASEPKPITHYARSKWLAEKKLVEISRQTGLQAVFIRPGVFYGLRPSPNLKQMLTMLQTKTVPVFGKNGQYRSYVDIEKVADVLVAAADRGHSEQPYLIGDGEPLNTREFYEVLGEGLGCRVRILPVPVVVSRLAEACTIGIGKSMDVHFRIGNIVGEFGRNTYFKSQTAEQLGINMHPSSRPGLIAMAQAFRSGP